MKHLLEKIKNVARKNVLVIGDVMLDEYIFGEVSRISPEAPVPVLREEKREWSLGGAANVALNCKQIGCNVSLIGLVGHDDVPGKKLISMLCANGISKSGIVYSNKRVTTCKKRMMASNHQLIRVDSEDQFPLCESELQAVKGKIVQCIRQGSIILVSDYAKGVLTSAVLQAIIKDAKKNNCMIIVDPKGTFFEKYRGVTYIKPNYKEYLQMLQRYDLSLKKSIVENGRRLCELLDLEGLIVTLGEKGIQFVSMKEDLFVPACTREVYDLTGAGDTVMAFLALGLAAGLQMNQCLNLSNHAAAVAISHVKTYAVSLDELLEKEYDVDQKVFFDWAMLKIELDWLKLENKKIVFTNGCFDLLHSGHLHVLQEAKKLGGILVVAVNTDASVKRFKGEGRPIKTLHERLKILASMHIVDFVVAFDQDTPKELIEYVKPDVLVKGADYKKEEVTGYDFMMKNGGVIHLVDLKQGFSTSRLVKAVKRTV
jgi:D-beta-D-heptose 7-phosphate kinase/D-beta-D-heptose 1-phosphate adenosyltransferase